MSSTLRWLLRHRWTGGASPQFRTRSHLVCSWTPYPLGDAETSLVVALFYRPFSCLFILFAPALLPTAKRLLIRVASNSIVITWRTSSHNMYHNSLSGNLTTHKGTSGKVYRNQKIFASFRQFPFSTIVLTHWQATPTPRNSHFKHYGGFR